jgi:hypothetical protein
MILAHGAAMTGLGLSLGVGLHRRRLAIAGGICLLLVAAVAWTILARLIAPNDPMGLILLNPILGISSLLNYSTLRPDELETLLLWARIWSVVLIFATMGLLWLTFRRVELRLRRAHRADEDLATASPPEPTARDAVLVGD